MNDCLYCRGLGVALLVFLVFRNLPFAGLEEGIRPMLQMLRCNGVSGFSGMEWWTGMVEWNGMIISWILLIVFTSV